MSKLYALIAALALLLLAGFASTASAEDEFCWRDTYGRGVGSVPLSCGPGEELIGLLCYPKCGANMKRFGFDCHSVCPAGFRDDGLFCRHPEYGRGWGYPWQFDDGFSNDGMISRCEKDSGKGKCEMWGAVAYPKCKEGYSPFGCCICRPPVPDCNALNLRTGIDLSCAKKIEIGSPRTGSCAPGEEYDAGLCYTKCGDGYEGLGPVCWGKPPPNWVECGMGAAKDEKSCGTIVFGQVESVGGLALSITKVTGTGSAKLDKLRKKFEELQKAYKKQLGAIDKARKVYDTYGAASNMVDLIDAPAGEVTEEDIARVSAEIAALADPTGVTGTVAAYTYSVCSKKFPASAKAKAPAPKPEPIKVSGQPVFGSWGDVVWAAPDRVGRISNAVMGGRTSTTPPREMGVCRVTQKATSDTPTYGGSEEIGSYDFSTGACETAFPVKELGNSTKVLVTDPNVAAKRYQVQVMVIRPGMDYGTLQWKDFAAGAPPRGSVCQAMLGREVRVGVAYLENISVDKSGNEVKGTEKMDQNQLRAAGIHFGTKAGCRLTYNGKSLQLASGGTVKIKLLDRVLIPQ